MPKESVYSACGTLVHKFSHESIDPKTMAPAQVFVFHVEKVQLAAP